MKKNIKNIGYFILGGFVTVLFFELFLNLTAISSLDFTVDKNVGDTFKPNRTINTLFMMEGFGLNKSNSDGGLDRDVDKNTSKNATFLLGNSYVASRQVFDRNNFIKIAEKSIRKDCNKDISIYNYGKRDMFLDEVLFRKKYLDSVYNPKYILVLLNDEMFYKERNIRAVPRYYFENDSLKLDTSFRKSSEYKLFNKLGLLTESSLVFLAYKAKGKLSQAPKIVLDKFYPEKQIKKDTTKKELIIAENDRKMIEALDKEKNVIFIVSSKSNNNQSIRKHIKKSVVIDFDQLLYPMVEQGKKPYYWKVENKNGHWNNKAHKELGVFLAKELQKVYNCTN